MRKYIALFLIMACLLVASCSNVTADFQIDARQNEVNIVFTENGVELTSAHVFVPYRKGDVRDVVFHITNNTGQTIKADIDKIFNVNPENDSKLEGKGYVPVKSYYSDWIQVPPLGYIPDGKDARYNMTIAIPADTAEKIPDKWVFVIKLASNTGGFVQVDCGVWIVVNTR